MNAERRAVQNVVQVLVVAAGQEFNRFFETVPAFSANPHGRYLRR